MNTDHRILAVVFAAMSTVAIAAVAVLCLPSPTLKLGLTPTLSIDRPQLVIDGAKVDLPPIVNIDKIHEPAVAPQKRHLKITQPKTPANTPAYLKKGKKERSVLTRSTGCRSCADGRCYTPRRRLFRRR